MNSSVVQAMELMALPDADALAVTAACEVVIGWAHARQIEAIEQVSREMPDFIDQTGELIDPAPAEVAAALHWSSGQPSTARTWRTGCAPTCRTSSTVYASDAWTCPKPARS